MTTHHDRHVTIVLYGFAQDPRAIADEVGYEDVAIVRRGRMPGAEDRARWAAVVASVCLPAPSQREEFDPERPASGCGSIETVEASYPENRADLSAPWLRQELLLWLADLANVDPRQTWAEERRRGRASGIDEVFHFLFDDHDFDETDLGRCLLAPDEARLIGSLKHSLQRVLSDAPNGDDAAFVEHPLWPSVTRAAAEALAVLRGR